MVRFKNRWLLVELIPAGDNTQLSMLDGKKIWSTLKQSVLQNFGDTGWGAVGSSLTVKYYSPTTKICIIRVARDHYRTAWGAVTLLTSIEDQKIIPNVIHVSGTIKHAQLAAVEHNRLVIARYRARAKSIIASRDTYENYLQVSTSEIQALRD